MILKCVKCRMSFRVNTSDLGWENLGVTCVHCSHSFVPNFFDEVENPIDNVSKTRREDVVILRMHAYDGSPNQDRVVQSSDSYLLENDVSSSSSAPLQLSSGRGTTVKGIQVVDPDDVSLRISTDLEPRSTTSMPEADALVGDLVLAPMDSSSKRAEEGTSELALFATPIESQQALDTGDASISQEKAIQSRSATIPGTESLIHWAITNITEVEKAPFYSPGMTSLESDDVESEAPDHSRANGMRTEPSDRLRPIGGDQAVDSLPNEAIEDAWTPVYFLGEDEVIKEGGSELPAAFYGPSLDIPPDESSVSGFLDPGQAPSEDLLYAQALEADFFSDEDEEEDRKWVVSLREEPVAASRNHRWSAVLGLVLGGVVAAVALQRGLVNTPRYHRLPNALTDVLAENTRALTYLTANGPVVVIRGEAVHAGSHAYQNVVANILVEDDRQNFPPIRAPVGVELRPKDIERLAVQNRPRVTESERSKVYPPGFRQPFVVVVTERPINGTDYHYRVEFTGTNIH